MITITITSDESLADRHFDVLHTACREVAENTGQLVHVKAEFTIAPTSGSVHHTKEVSDILASIEKAARNRLQEPPKVHDTHKWPDLNDSASIERADSFDIDWSKAPAWAEYHMFDQHGFGHYYSSYGDNNAPTPDSIHEISGRVRALIANRLDYTKSLRRRPTVKDSLTDDPFAVDWSKAPEDATHHAFDSVKKELKGHWYKGHPAKDNEEFLSHGSACYIKASGFILPAGLADRWHESLTRRHVPASISTTESMLLRDQAN